MGYPDGAAAQRPEPDTASGPTLAWLARQWLRSVAGVAFIPGPRVRARECLEFLLHRLAQGLQTEPFDPAIGYLVGVDLVGARMSSPDVLGRTLTLLGERLLPALGVGRQPAAELRLQQLLGQLAVGFTTTLRDAAAGAAEEINRAERAVWRRQQLILQRRMQHALLHDPLTGLPNRSKLFDSVATLIADAGRDQRIGICLIRITRLATVNDTLGHEVGDHLLRQVARRLRPAANRQGHPLAHLDGDEFALVLPATTGPDDAVKAAEAALRVLVEPCVVDGHPIEVAAKAGIVEQPAADANAVELLRRAHIAAGWAIADRNRQYAVFDPQRSSVDIDRHRLAAILPTAIRSGQFYLDYQPLVRLSDRAVVGVEALARWRHPTLGKLGPDQFIGLAEQTGLIQPLGLHLLERACEQAARWQRRLWPPYVSVNLAPAQLQQPDLVAAVVAALDRSRLPPCRLQLEITESTAIDAHHDVLRRLAGLGVRLAIDDFGTGYSSLAYLTELPVRTVKLAARFLDGLREPGAAGPSSKILDHLITMCHDLGISVTAEGVESVAQARHLERLHCDTGQGYLFARPTTPRRLTRMLDGRLPGPGAAPR